MDKILLSINPEYADKIINGEKRFEYRKFVPKNDISSIIIYETKPVRKIIAEAEVIGIIMLTPENLWLETKRFSGITKEQFDDYFHERHVAYAYKLGRITVYKKPMELKDFGLKSPPQSFVYIKK